MTDVDRDTADQERVALPDDDAGDFAGEHDETTVAEQVAGGPERAPEPESPRGHAGMDD